MVLKQIDLLAFFVCVFHPYLSNWWCFTHIILFLIVSVDDEFEEGDEIQACVLHTNMSDKTVFLSTKTDLIKFYKAKKKKVCMWFFSVFKQVCVLRKLKLKRGTGLLKYKNGNSSV